EQLVQQHARTLRQLVTGAVRARGLVDIAQALAPDVADVFVQLRAALRTALLRGERIDLTALGFGDHAPLAALTAELDHRAKRGLVQRLLLERAPEARLGLLVFAECARRDTEPVPDVADDAVADVRAVAREDLAVALVDLAPLLVRSLAALVRLRLGHQHGGEADRSVEAVRIVLDGEP